MISKLFSLYCSTGGSRQVLCKSIRGSEKLKFNDKEFLKLNQNRTITGKTCNMYRKEQDNIDQFNRALPIRKKFAIDRGQMHDSPLSKTEFLYGIFPVLLGLQSRRRLFIQLYYKKDLDTNNAYIEEIFHLCDRQGIPTESVPKSTIKRMTSQGSVTQGICIEATPLKFISMRDIKDANINDHKENFWIYLDQINDPMNFGAVLRTVCFFGISHVITGMINCCPLSPTVSKASSGAAEIQPVYCTEDPTRLIESLKQNNWDVLCGVANDSSKTKTALKDLQRKQNTLLIVGNEGKGISKHLEDAATHFITIPPHNDCHPRLQSLNVSVATSLLIYSLKSVQNKDPY